MSMGVYEILKTGREAQRQSLEGMAIRNERVRQVIAENWHCVRGGAGLGQ